MSAWTDSLRAASFRGVPFEVDSQEFTGGRRVVVHELPDVDAGVTEDLGRKPRMVPFTAYVFGDNAVEQSRQLIRACETRGPGVLVHPAYGDLRAVCPSYRAGMTWDQGRAVSLSLEFIEAGELEFIEVDTTGALGAAADDLDLAGYADFLSGWSIDDLATFVRTNALARIDDALDLIEDVVSTPFSAVQAAASIVADVAGFKLRLADLADAPGDFYDALVGLVAQIGNLLGLSSLVVTADYVAPGTTTTSETANATNTYAVTRALTRAALAASARVLADTSLTVYDDAITARDTLAAQVDAEAEVSTDPAVFAALRALRVAVVEDVTSRAADLARVTTYTVPSVRSSLVIAQTLYADGTRADEIGQRNGVVHPLFVAAGDIQVLSE